MVSSEGLRFSLSSLSLAGLLRRGLCDSSRSCPEGSPCELKCSLSSILGLTFRRKHFVILVDQLISELSLLWLDLYKGALVI